MEGAWALFDSLRANQSLLWLGIGGNSLGDRGVLHLVALLQGTNGRREGGRRVEGKEGHHVHVPPGLTEDQCPLQSIGLGGNDIQDEGAALLATALKSNTHLQCLGLGGNQICEPYSCTVLLNKGGKHSLKLTVVDIL